MDEDNYREAYERINTAPCVFEKGILAQKCQCAFQQLFRLADRHGVGCKDALMQQSCSEFLDHLRKQTRFVFKINIDGPLPHNKEMKVQAGGMLGMQQLLLAENSEDVVSDISALMTQAIATYGSLESVPYNLIMPAVTNYQTRPKRKRDK